MRPTVDFPNILKFFSENILTFEYENLFMIRTQKSYCSSPQTSRQRGTEQTRLLWPPEGFRLDPDFYSGTKLCVVASM